MNDGDYGSFDLQYGVEMDLPPQFETASEFIDTLHENLADQLYQALVDQNILHPKD